MRTCSYCKEKVCDYDAIVDFPKHYHKRCYLILARERRDAIRGKGNRVTAKEADECNHWEIVLQNWGDIDKEPPIGEIINNLQPVFKGSVVDALPLLDTTITDKKLLPHETGGQDAE